MHSTTNPKSGTAKDRYRNFRINVSLPALYQNLPIKVLDDKRSVGVGPRPCLDHQRASDPAVVATTGRGLSSPFRPGAVPGVGPKQDLPDFLPAGRQPPALAIGTILVDAGYKAEHTNFGIRKPALSRTTARQYSSTSASVSSQGTRGI